MRWSVPRWMPAVEGLAAVSFATAAVMAREPLATAMAVVAAGILTVVAVRDAVAAVRLSADADGVTVVHGFNGHRQLPWAEMLTITVGRQGRNSSRLGRSAGLLEIDAGDTVHLFSRRELGADPAEVADVLESLRRQALNP